VKTLNQIVAEVESWASSHLQVHSFGQGDIWEISPSSSQFTFPLMWVTVGQSDPREMEMVDQFNVLVCDLVDTGEKNELEVLSDTRQILRDLVAWYRQQHSAAYIVEFQGAITPFTERFAERVSGHALTIRLRQPYDYDSCAIPLGTPLPAPPFCEPATFTLINTATPPATLDSGSIPSGGSDVIVAPAVTVLRDGLPFAVEPSGGTVDVPSNCVGGSVSLAVSNTTPNVGSNITLTATPSGFTPTNYLFFARQGNDLYQIGENSTGVLNWQVNIFGTFSVFVQADDSSTGAFNVGGDAVTSPTVVLNDLALRFDTFKSLIVAPTYLDLSGLNRHGTLINSPAVTGGIGGYLTFNGIDQAVENIGGLSDFSFIQNTLVFTIGAWVYITDLTGRNPIITNTATGTERGFNLSFENANFGGAVGLVTKRLIMNTYRGGVGIRFIMSDDNVITSVGWNYVTLTMNGSGTAQFYLNGQPITTTEQNTPELPTGNSTRTVSVGRITFFSGFFTGRIAPVQVYTRALTAQEVEDNFEADKVRYGF